MIPKGNQRAGGQQLATHLLNAYDNDRVEVIDVRGAVANDLHGAFAEWHAIAKGTRCTKYLYSLSLNPDHTQGATTPAHYRDFITRTEDRLGLKGQPRAIVVHVKHGREHYHVVWSRIDPETLKAIQLSHDRPKLRAVAQAFAEAHGIQLPPGMREDGEREKSPHAANLAEKQQEERTGEKKEDRVAAITAAWMKAKTGPDFVKALRAGGYTLARGKRRAFVIVDRFGEVHSLSRQLAGVTAKELKSRLTDYHPDTLPDADQVQARARQQGEAIRPTAGFWTRAESRRAELKQEQATRRADLDGKRAALDRRQRLEIMMVRARIVAENARIGERRAALKPGPVVAAFARVTGISALIGKHWQRQDTKRETLQTIRLDALKRRQKRERLDFQRHYRALGRVETRETRSLETALKRELLEQLAQEPGMTQSRKAVEIAKLGETRVTDAFNRGAAPDTGKGATVDRTLKNIDDYERRHPPRPPEPLDKKPKPGL